MCCILLVQNYFFWDGFIGFSRLPKESAGRCVRKDPCLRHRVGEAGTVPLLTRDARGQLARGSRTRSRVCARTEILLLISTMLPPVQPSLTHSGSMSFMLMGIIRPSRPTHTHIPRVKFSANNDYNNNSCLLSTRYFTCVISSGFTTIPWGERYHLIDAKSSSEGGDPVSQNLCFFP